MPSNSVKNEIIDRYGIKYANKIVVVHPGVDLEADLKFDDSVLSGYQLEKYIMYVGAFYPHKNIQLLIEAFSIFQEKFPGYKLVLAGEIDTFGEKLVKKFGNLKNIIFTNFVTDSQLNSLFKNSSLYINPSISEGFNLTPLEAWQAGTEKIALANIEVNREIYSDLAYIFDSYEAKSLAKKLEQIVSDKTKANYIVKKNQYSFKQMTDNLVELMLSSKTRK